MRDLGYLAQDISILHRSYYKDTAQAFRGLGLNPTAACILLAVHDSPRINQRRISDYLAIDKGLTTREVARLESSGYVRRVPGRGKSVLLEPTDAGENAVGTVRRIRRDWWSERFDETGVTERSELMSGIERIVRSLTGRLEPEATQSAAQEHKLHRNISCTGTQAPRLTGSACPPVEEFTDGGPKGERQAGNRTARS